MHNCLVLGGANTVFEEVRRAVKLGEFHGVVTCNDVTAEWAGEIEAAVSLHGDKWPIWLKKRRMNGYSEPKRVVVHAALEKSPVRNAEVAKLITNYHEYLWPGQQDPGSTGLFACKFVMDTMPEFDKIVLCGVGMNIENRHYFDDRPWLGAISMRRGWTQTVGRLLGTVKSMGGWTSELLGKPSEKWLAEGT